MKVRELLECLQRCDPDADVLLTSQPNWPMEHQLLGAVTRNDMAPRGNSQRQTAEPNAVILVEGDWLGYGQQDAWDVVQARRQG